MSDRRDAGRDGGTATGWLAEQSPGFLLWHIENLWQRRQRAALEPWGLTIVQYLLLAGTTAAERERVPLTQIVLARRCRTDPMMTSQVVRTLEREGLVRRVRSRSDRRAVTIAPTLPGRERAAAAEAAVREVEESFFAGLGADVPAFADALRILGGERPRRRVRAGSRPS